MVLKQLWTKQPQITKVRGNALLLIICGAGFAFSFYNYGWKQITNYFDGMKKEGTAKQGLFYYLNK